MNLLLASIALNEQSYSVVLLHKTMEVLGFPAAKKEVAERKAGPDTRKQVRALQKQLNVAVDESTLIDAASAAAIGESLHKRGLLSANRSFTVTGAVRSADGSTRKKQRLMAFDLDLKGVAIYRSVKSLDELAKNGGFEFLGQTTTDSKGNYRITFYDWQYRRAERKKADVVVYAVNGDGKRLTVVGASRMVSADDYSDKGLVDGLDISVAQTERRTEYETLMAALEPFLSESETTLRAVAASQDQLAFTASELDVDSAHLDVAAEAELLGDAKENRLSHELLYGIGRQSIRLSWPVLNRKSEAELQAAIAASVKVRVIRAPTEKALAAFFDILRLHSAQATLDSKTSGNAGTLNEILGWALPKQNQRVAFTNALSTFEGKDYREFWTKHLPSQPEFKDQPKLIDAVLLAQQFTLLTGNHQQLVTELQKNSKLSSPAQLLDLEDADWLKLIAKSGVPAFVQGVDDKEKAETYARQIQSLLNAAFPTQRVAKMLAQGKLPVEKNAAKGIEKFLSKTPRFDIAVSRIHEFEKEIEAAAGNAASEVKAELKKFQRVFQVSTTPEAMTVLLENNLSSAYSIANMPRKTFMKTYGDALGGSSAAFAIHQRAAHMTAKTESAAMRMMDYSTGYSPAYAFDVQQQTEALIVLQKQVPNYSELFGSPDLCECETCRSVYSAAAYFVDLLQFLWRGEPNDDGQTPLDRLRARRPDLAYLPLTCENTNTIIPYIDLANEVMEYYTANDSLAAYQGYDTGEATAEELRANPQNFNLEAYRIVKDSQYPFTLPYHQPLDVIRTYSDHLQVSRYDALVAINPEPDATTENAIAAESLRLCDEEYRILTGTSFDGAADATQLFEYFGYAAAGDLEDLSAVREFLSRSGTKYTDLVELVKTQFLNPAQFTLDFLEKIFAYATIDANAIYTKLKQISAGTLDPTVDADITATLTAYNTAEGTSLTAEDFGEWMEMHFAEFQQVVTLYEPESKCDLDTTSLRTIESIYEAAATSGVTDAWWSKAHRFIRLWRKLGWTIHETDLLLTALSDTDIKTDTIAKLEAVVNLRAASKQSLDKLAVLWGAIDTYGDKSLYKKLFLNKSVQQIDTAFAANVWGNYLQDAATLLVDHQSALLAAFRISDEDLTAILAVANVIDGGVPRVLDLNTDVLNLGNLSTIYRFVVLAKTLKSKIADLCELVTLFAAAPFSLWDVQLEQFVDIDPTATYEFYQLAKATKAAGFKATVLQYILDGTLPANSSIGLNTDKALKTAKSIRDAFDSIEQDHPQVPSAPLTAEIITAKLTLTFQADTIARLMSIIDDTASFETLTDLNLLIAIPDDLASKYTYIKGSGRLTCTGVMTDDERDTLQALANATANFNAAVDELYDAPEIFVSENFSGVFTDLAATYATLLDHPAQAPAATLDVKLAFVYEQFIPILKAKLRRDAITQHIASLIGLSDAATALLIAADIDVLIDDLSTAGLSATYFSDPAWTNVALARTDATADFSWGAAAPDPAVPADNFSVRWESYIAAPASGEYTLVIDVQEADEAFQLYLDGALILEKAAGDVNTTLEVVVSLNAAQLQLLRLDYSEDAQNAGVRVQWKTETTALTVLPSSAAYPAAILDSFVNTAALLHRAAKFVSGFKLTETELSHLIAWRADFGDIDFKAIVAGDWERINDYVTLRMAVPQAQALLTDVFALANQVDPPPTVLELQTELYNATAWDAANLDFLINTHFTLGVDDFKNEIALNRVRAVMEIVSETGISAEVIAEWGAVETDFDALNSSAQTIKNAVNAKYEEADWLAIAGDLSDTIRTNQQQALVAHLLTRPAIQSWGATDADGLFEYFLIDVQMGCCMDTSRIVQANSSVQMFVNRCLLNLESDQTAGAETGVSPGAIGKDRWEWMKNYRVWEANRKVFLYPENWLEPEWRTDRSEFFKDLESYLLQNDITDRSVEAAFRTYLGGLNDVANLEVCGLHRENYADGKLKYLHVFGRTHNAPYKFFYRRWNEYRKWTPWEKVGLDIRSVENGVYSGVHLIPVVWKNRFFLFWPEFVEQQESPDNSTQSAESLSNDSMSTYQAKKFWLIRLAWSEYVDGKWSAKQVSKESLKQYEGTVVPYESRTRFVYSIDSQSVLQIALHVEFDGYWCEQGAFYLSDITSPVVTGSGSVPYTEDKWYGYRLDFMKFAKLDKLELADDVYLQNSTDHRLLITPTRADYVPRLVDPFFFADTQRTYFVRPVVITIVDWVKNPDYYLPYTPVLVTDAVYQPPHIGPDDYFPISSTAIGFSGNPVGIASNIANASNGFVVGAEPVANLGGVAMRGMAMASSTVGAASIGAAAIGGDQMTSKSYQIGHSYVDSAFGAINVVSEYGYSLAKHSHGDIGFEFHTFYHPYSGNYVENLNVGGMSNLLESDTSLSSDEGSKFVSTYNPNFTHGFVQKPADFATRTYYKENVCFDVYGANSSYNWELFFHAPLYIATRLSKNGQYEEAMRWFHYIFDPTTDALPEAGESEISRYWKVLPFKTTAADSLEDWFRSLAPNNDPNTENALIAEWRDNPFDPHLIASNRPLAYMKNVVIKYVENLVAWGDSLFRQDSMESVNEALQIYVIANHILGPKPEFVPKRGDIQAESYASLEGKWDDFSNALVELENIFPYSSSVSVSDSENGGNLLGVGPALYFCIPANDKLLESWDTVTDRLYKIRHCQNIDGVERKLALFSPPIDPAALIQAASQGLSLGSILADLSSPPPIYRFTFLIQKANEFCADVKALGAALLNALEKKDAEELGRLRAAQETQMLELMTAIKDRQVLDAKARRESLDKARETAAFRLQHFADLLDNGTVTLPSAPTISATLTADSQLPADTTIASIEAGVDVSLVDSDESGVKLIPKEKENMTQSQSAKEKTGTGNTIDAIGGLMNFIPTFSGNIEPFGIGLTMSYGGSNIAGGMAGIAKFFHGGASDASSQAAMAMTMATFIRREQEWAYQGNLAAKDIVQLDKQITSADIQIQVAEQELTNHKQQIENAEAVETLLQNKFTNQELYQWLKEQLFSVFKQSYNLAFDMAKKAEKAYRFEMGASTASFIQYGYWDNSMQGLVAGEKLQLALRQLEKSYLDENRRELELTKSISLARLDPLALIELRETGKCYVTLPEELFDFDFRGHYFRRIKAVRLSLPCIVGPYTSVSCSLRLLNNSIRVNTSMNSEGKYEHENDEGTAIDDDRFVTNYIPVAAIATSAAQADSGMFEFNFRDERYLPFERAGAISTWEIELSTEKELRQFDYATIADAVLHLNYTSREEGGLFKDGAVAYMKEFIANVADRSDQPLVQLVDLKHEFPTEWYKFLHPAAVGGEQALEFTIGKERLPFFVHDRDIVVEKLEVFARCAEDSTYKSVLSYLDPDDESVTSDEISMPQTEAYGGLNKATVEVNGAGLDLEELDIDRELTIKVKRNGVADFKSLATNPDEIEDLFLVVHYKLVEL